MKQIFSADEMYANLPGIRKGNLPKRLEIYLPYVYEIKEESRIKSSTSSALTKTQIREYVRGLKNWRTEAKIASRGFELLNAIKFTKKIVVAIIPKDSSFRMCMIVRGDDDEGHDVENNQYVYFTPSTTCSQFIREPQQRTYSIDTNDPMEILGMLPKSNASDKYHNFYTGSHDYWLIAAALGTFQSEFDYLRIPESIIKGL